MLARRQVIQGAAAVSFAGLPLAAILANPELARATAAGLEEQTLPLKSGKKVRAFLDLPAKTPAPVIVLVHEWWGLNDQIKAVTAEFAKLGYVALAIDLMSGNVATTRDAAQRQMQKVGKHEALETASLWIDWIRQHKASSGKIGTIGWCFGGGWSLNASIAEPVDATVVYYGRVNQPAAELKRLKGPVLGHFATQDQWINARMVKNFEAGMKLAGKSYASHWYDAKHGFANPTTARYDEPDAKLAWTRTTEFFKQHLF